MITINGAYGEGGGQILRTSLTLSALTGTPVHIHNIRANRKQPGLRAQHLAAVAAIAKIANARTEGVLPGSTALTLSPSNIRPGRYHFDIGTAGSIALVLQTIFLPLSVCEASSDVTLTGGTHVQWSPSFDFIQAHWLPLMEHLGFRAQSSLHKAGFYPKGGGECGFKILPAKNLQSFICEERGDLIHIQGLSGVANLDDSIAKRQKHQALRRLYPVCKDTKIKTIRLSSPGKGTFLMLKATFTKPGRAFASSACYSSLGELGKPAELVADEAVDQMLEFLNSIGCIDQYLADQLLLPLSFIGGASKFRTNCITQHLLTNAHVIKQFLPIAIHIDSPPQQPGMVQLSNL